MTQSTQRELRPIGPRRTALLVAIAVAAPFALVALPGAAVADTTVFSEDFETSGFPGWTVSGAATRDCAIGQSGCSLKLAPTTGGSTASVERTINAAMGNGVILSFYFRGSAITGNTDTSVLVSFASGGSSALSLTDGPATANNGLRLFSPGSNQFFGVWALEDTWYRAELVFDTTNDAVRAQIYEASGTVPIAASGTLAIPSAASTISTIKFSASSTLSSGTVQFRYDTLRVVDPSPDVPLGLPDTDGDGIPQDLETLVCGREVVRNIINGASETLGSCPSSTNYVPPVHAATIEAVEGAEMGPDADNDDIPAYIRVKTAKYTVSSAPPHLSTENTGGIDLTIDMFEGNDQLPVIDHVCTPIPIAAGAGLSNTDADNDDFPAFAVITRSNVCADRTEPDPIIESDAGSLQQVVDPDDADPGNPLTTSVTLPPVPTAARFGPDNDKDAIPSTREIQMTTMTVYRTDVQNPDLENEWQATTLDPNDNNRNSPVPYSLVDSDADWVPDASETWLCLAEDDNMEIDGTCNSGSNYVPPSWYQMVLHMIGL